MIKRYYISILLITALLLSSGAAFASDITNALNRATIRVTNNGTAASGVSVNFSLNSTAFYNAGHTYTSNMSDVVIQYNGSDVKFMPAFGASRSWMMFVDSIGAGQNADYDFYSYNGTGGDIVYFPDSDGMTIDDDASMELADNGTIELDAYLGASGNLTVKEGAIATTYDLATENVTAQILSVNTTEQTVSTSFHAIHSAAGHRSGERYTSFPVVTIDSVSFYLLKTGSPTGTANITVRRVSDDAILGTLGTLDVSTLTGAYVWYTANASSVSNPTEQDVRVLFEYSGGDGSNYVRVSTSEATDELAGAVATSYTPSSYTDYGYDSSIKLTYTAVTSSVAVTGVSAGEHIPTVNITPDYLELGVDIDDSTRTPSSANHTLGLPLWSNGLNGSVLTSVDANEFTANVTGATWSNSNGRDFAGGTDVITVEYNSDFGGGDGVSDNPFTIIAWVNMDDASAFPLFSKGEANKYEWLFQVGSDDEVELRCFSPTASSRIGRTYTTALTSYEGTFIMLAATYDATEASSGIKLYLNTSRVDNSNDEDLTPAYVAMTDNGASPRIGKVWDSGASADGKFGEVHFYSNKVFSPTEITNFYNTTKWKYDGSGDLFDYTAGATVPDNANDWVIGSDATTYINTYKHYVDGVLQSSIAWEYGSTFTDLSGNGNDATPTFRTTASDAGVSASFIDLGPVSAAEVDTFTLVSTYSILSGTPTSPSGLFDDSNYDRLPVAWINEILGEGNIPQAAWWFPFVFLMIAVIGFIVYGATTITRGVNGRLQEGQFDGSLFFTGLVIECLLLVFWKFGVIPGWPMILYLIPWAAIVMSKKHFSWG